MHTPFAPLIAITRPDSCSAPTLAGIRIQLKVRHLRSATIWETHLAKNPLKMRLPTSTHLRNPLNKRDLQRHE
jgi:hypothetical protein